MQQQCSHCLRMTITYSGNFLRLLCRWKGSLWKAIWLELLVFLTLFYAIEAVHRFALTKEQKILFNQVAKLFDEYTMRIPMTFLLGFYVNAVVKRWWEQFSAIGWPDDLLHEICALLPGRDADAVKKRRTIARWLILSTCLAWRDISAPVRKRFPTVRHLVHGGLMTEQEYDAYYAVVAASARWQLPLMWIQRLMEREIAQSGVWWMAPLFSRMIDNMNKYREGFRMLYCYDWVCIPLVYTQVSALAAYGYFALALIGHQNVRERSGENQTIQANMNRDEILETGRSNVGEIDTYVPVVTILQFMFCIGWFKVGQYLMRPFEDDDDDLELNYLIDRHLETAFSLVDQSYDSQPPETSDLFKDSVRPFIPHTKDSLHESINPPKLHAIAGVSKDTRLHELFTVTDPDALSGQLSKQMLHTNAF